jgi:hypothetical protein
MFRMRSQDCDITQRPSAARLVRRHSATSLLSTPSLTDGDDQDTPWQKDDGVLSAAGASLSRRNFTRPGR